MIQRPQSLFFAALIALALMMMFSDIVFYKVSDAKNESSEVIVEYDETRMLASDGEDTQQNTALFYVLACTVILAVISIFSFKNRKLQASLTAFNFIAILLTIIMMYFYSFKMQYFEDQDGGLTFASALPLAMMFFNFIALRGIRKDEHLVRSMDRFR